MPCNPAAEFHWTLDCWTPGLVSHHIEMGFPFLISSMFLRRTWFSLAQHCVQIETIRDRLIITKDADVFKMLTTWLSWDGDHACRGRC